METYTKLWKNAPSRKVEESFEKFLDPDPEADGVTYKLGVIMHRYQHGKAPRYLVECCTPTTHVVGRRRLRSATQQLMVVPGH